MILKSAVLLSSIFISFYYFIIFYPIFIILFGYLVLNCTGNLNIEPGWFRAEKYLVAEEWCIFMLNKSDTVPQQHLGLFASY